eukprot:4251015-Alexandrium_andersonii.AAC.1
MEAEQAADDGAPDDPVAAIDGLLASFGDQVVGAVFDAGATQEASAELVAAEPAAAEVPAEPAPAEVPHWPTPPQRAPPAG